MIGLNDYRMPGIYLLRDYSDQMPDVTREEVERNGELIKTVLEDYKIDVLDISACSGPVNFTLYEVVPARRVRESQIKGLENDIAFSLGKRGVRVVQHTETKTISIEVPNDEQGIVSMCSVLNDYEFITAKYDLPVVIGRTVFCGAYSFDLAEMPHLLVAGSMGQGKSVFMHGIIASLLCRQRPEDIKLLLVDTKGVEFASYSRLGKAFLAQMPDGGDAVINDAGKAVVALGALYAEMKLRRELMEMAWEVDLASYNATFASGRLDAAGGHRHLPRLVMVVDEYRDIIRQYGRSFETMVCVLAGLGHEVGIHLIIATRLVTQSVITGKIKDAFPARAAFRVSQQIDSRALLGDEGADVLLGKGDMIFSHDDAKERLQAPLIEVGEIDKLVEYVSRECETAGCTGAYTLPAPEDCGDGDAGAGSRVTERDPLFDEASRFAERAKGVTVEKLQRKFALGYNRATRLLEQLRDAGIVPDDK